MSQLERVIVINNYLQQLPTKESLILPIRLKISLLLLLARQTDCFFYTKSQNFTLFIRNSNKIILYSQVIFKLKVKTVKLYRSFRNFIQN